MYACMIFSLRMYVCMYVCLYACVYLCECCWVLRVDAVRIASYEIEASMYVCMYVYICVGIVRSVVCVGGPDRDHRCGNGSGPPEEGDRATAAHGGILSQKDRYCR